MSRHSNSFDKDEEKQWQIAFSRCRTCDHTRFLHSNLAAGYRCMDVVPHEEKKAKWCECREFIPAENLDYLEWKYQQKKDKK